MNGRQFIVNLKRSLGDEAPVEESMTTPPPFISIAVRK